MEFDWLGYESAARTLYFRIWRHDFGDVLHCYLVDKPLATFNQIRLSWRADSQAQRQAHDLYFNPFGIVPLLIAAPGLLLVTRGGPTRWLIVALLLLLCFSLVPGLMFYSVTLTMMGTFASIAVLTYALTGTLLRQAVLAVNPDSRRLQ